MVNFELISYFDILFLCKIKQVVLLDNFNLSISVLIKK